MRSTRLLTRDNVEVTVPNAVIGNSMVVNESSGPSPRMRVRVSVGVAYGSDVEQVRELLLACTEDIPRTSKSHAAAVRFKAMGDSALDFQVLVWAEHPQFRKRYPLVQVEFRPVGIEGDRPPEFEEGAVGISTALIYAPADYASTEELVRLAKAVAEYDGLYISHMRSEGSQLLEALDELFTIAREAGIRSEIYHLKASRRGNWHKLDELIRRVEQAQKDGLQITADMYTYNASSTGLTTPSGRNRSYRAAASRRAVFHASR
jgi:hypothetical protein